MGRHANGGFSTPLAPNGIVPAQNGRGRFTLLANTTYYFPIDGADCSVIAAHLCWTDSPIIITSAKIEDCNRPAATGITTVSDQAVQLRGNDTEESEDFDARVGVWVDEDPTTGFVGVVGTNVSATNGVVAATGDAAGGGCMFHVADTGARRTRVRVQVGATGGDLSCFVWGKE